MKKKQFPPIKLKRVYDKPLKIDGYRVLIDRLWPRGLRKDKALLDEWAKEIAPTDRLRKWFDHDPDCWQEFKRKYKSELKQNTFFNDFIERLSEKDTITFLYATKYDQLTHAIVLKELIEDSYLTRLNSGL